MKMSNLYVLRKLCKPKFPWVSHSYFAGEKFTTELRNAVVFSSEEEAKKQSVQRSGYVAVLLHEAIRDSVATEIDMQTNGL